MAILALVVVLGCAAKAERSIVGSWNQGPVDSKFDSGWTFHADKTFEWWFDGKKIHNTSRGTWELEGNKLTMTTAESIITSGKVIKPRNPIDVATLRWISEDEFELASSERIDAFRRREPKQN